MARDTSQFRLISIGIAVRDLPRDSSVLEIWPVESNPDVSGNLTKALKEVRSSIPNASGVIKTSKVLPSQTLKATWTCLSGGNRVSPPNIKQNESVGIYKYADDEEYYWDKLMSEPDLRGLEDVVHMFGGTDKPGVKKDKNNSYWFQVNTIDGEIKLKTSRANKEKAAYDISINTKTGQFHIKDDYGNDIHLNSPTRVLTINVETTKIKKLIVDDIKCSGDINAQGTVHGSTVSNASTTLTT